MKKWRYFWLLAIAGLYSVSSGLLGKPILLTNTEGDSIRCIVIGGDEKFVTIRRTDGEEFTFPIVLLSEESRKLVRKEINNLPTGDEKEVVAVSKSETYIHQGSRIDVEVKKSRTDALDKAENYDNVNETLKPAVRIRNEEIYDHFDNHKCIIIMYGESVLNRQEYKVLYREEFTFSVAPTEEFFFEGTSFTNKYDKWNTAQFGHQYEGYGLVILDPDGEICYTKATSSKLEEAPEFLVNTLKPGVLFSRNMKKIGGN